MLPAVARLLLVPLWVWPQEELLAVFRLAMPLGMAPALLLLLHQVPLPVVCPPV